MKVIKQYFHVVLFTTLHKVILTFTSEDKNPGVQPLKQKLQDSILLCYTRRVYFCSSSEFEHRLKPTFINAKFKRNIYIAILSSFN